MSQVIVFGSVKMVLSVRTPHLPAPGETVSGEDDWDWAPGGKALNQAVAASRARTATTLVGRIGQDQPGDAIVAYLEDELIDCSRLVRSSTKPTGTSCVWVSTQTGENSIISSPGATAELSESDFAQLKFAPGDVALGQFSAPPAIVETFLREAGRQGAVTILNAAPAKPVSTQFLASLDVLVVNEVELTNYLAQFNLGWFLIEEPEATLGAVDRLCDFLGTNAVVATLGAAGVVVATAAGQPFHLPTHKVKAVDTTGAGDCFLGNLAAKLSIKKDLPEAIIWANAAATLSVQKPGAAPSMPTRRETAAFLKSQPTTPHFELP